MKKNGKNTVKQSKDELLSHLKEHILFLSMSARAYDQGVTGEAKRIAVSLRVLLHDTDSSHSLLEQLGLKVSFYNTANKYNPKNILTHHGLTALVIGNNEAKHVAPLDSRHKDVPLSQALFPDWWNEPIIVDKDKNVLSRRKLVLAMANQDGGAHVDPELDEVYAKISRNNSVGWIFTHDNKQEPVRPVELASMRQICYEVLYTFKKKFPQYFTEDLTL